MRVGEGKGHSDELLHGPAMDELSEADRNLATALVMGVLRWEIALDAQVRKVPGTAGSTVGGAGVVGAEAGGVSAAAYGSDSGACGFE